MDDLQARRRQFDEEVVNGHDLDAIPKLLFTAMPDIHIDVAHVVVEGDTTAARFVITGTDTGGFMGMPAGVIPS